MKHISKLLFFTAILTYLLVSTVLAGTAPQKEDEKTSLWLLSSETTYTKRSGLHGTVGRGDSLYGDYSIDRRFPISGNWYFRTGAEYERLDFGGSSNGLPNHLQAIYAHLAVEYIVQDHAGAGASLEPGYYFQNRISGDAFDVPWRIWMSFPLRKDKVFGVIGVGGSLYQNPVVAPGGGIIWLINEKVRVEGVFPKPALIYSPNDNWEFRLLGEIVFESFHTDDVAVLGKPWLNNAVVQYSEYRGGMQVSYSGFKPFNICVGAGYTFQRKFDFFRADWSQRVGGAPYVKVGLEAKF